MPYPVTMYRPFCRRRPGQHPLPHRFPPPGGAPARHEQRLDLASLDGAVQFFSEKGVAESTRKTYQSAARRFHNFCVSYNVHAPFPVSERLLTYFATYLAQQGLKERSIRTYIAAVRYLQLTLGLPDPRDSSLPHLRLILTGIKRSQAEEGSYAARPRLPITPVILRRIRELWNSRPNRGDFTMPWAAVTLCFFGFFRSGEITVPSQEAYDARFHLGWGDVAIDNPRNPQVIRVHLRRSKTDQFGNGVDVAVGRTGDVLCPVAAVASYMASRGTAPGPFFLFPDGTALTKARFTGITREALRELGLPQVQFAGHSFRIGAATAAAQAGLEDSWINTLGRWNSTAFLRYIRTLLDSLAATSARLSRSSAPTP